uniref:Uncharacterized protein n=1 Tax=Fundulus heteroclitus TaxID=8078 RepID=A0A3Q2NWE1_FUNHE
SNTSPQSCSSSTGYLSSSEFSSKSSYLLLKLFTISPLPISQIYFNSLSYIWGKEFTEDLLCCLNISTGTTSEQMFSVLNNFVVTKCNLDWSRCKGITTDGAKYDRNTGKDIVWNQCFIHQRALACKRMPADLTKTMQEVIRLVNFIKSSSLNCRLFEKVFLPLCSNMAAEHTYLLFHTEVLWNEIHAFPLEKKSPLTKLFTDEWVFALSYLAAMFSLLNELSLKMQGEHDGIFHNWKHVLTFQKSLALWLLQASKNVTDTHVKHLTGLIVTHLVALIDSFDHYYPKERDDILSGKGWIQSPFAFEIPESLLDLGLTLKEETEKLQLSSDSLLKRRHGCMRLSSFWISISSSLKAPILLLIPFTIYIKMQSCVLNSHKNKNKIPKQTIQAHPSH